MRGLPFEYAVRNMTRNPVRLLLSAGGCGLVVLLVMAAGGFVSGMQRSLRTSGAANNVMLIGAGSEESVERSEIPMRTTGIAASGIRGVQRIAGVDAVSPEVHVAIPVISNGDAEADAANMIFRGVTPAAFLVHREARVTAGRFPATGGDEIALGVLAARGLGWERVEDAIGEELVVDDRPFTVVGLLEADGGVIEGEIWMPVSDLVIVTKRDTLSCVVVRLDSENITSAAGFAATRLDLELVAIRESDYYAALAAFFTPIRLMVIVTAILVATGGVIGGLNTTYAAFASRVREIGTLQTLGYTRPAIVRSLVLESVLTASIGGLVAAAIGMLVLDQVTIRFSMGVFGLAIGPGVLVSSLLAGLLLGVLGAFVPAIRCLRLPVPEALRAA
jgi:putative ABC transport system permease protein